MQKHFHKTQGTFTVEHDDRHRGPCVANTVLAEGGERNAAFRACVPEQEVRWPHHVAGDVRSFVTHSKTRNGNVMQNLRPGR